MGKEIHILSEGDSWFVMIEVPGFDKKRGKIVYSSGVAQEFFKLFENGEHIYKLVGREPIPSANLSGAQKGIPSVSPRVGDTIVSMWKDKEAIEREFEKHTNTGKPIKALIFSGGGNDLIDALSHPCGSEESILLKADDRNGPFNITRLDQVKNSIKEHYTNFVTLCQGYNVKLITHTYCRPNLNLGGTKVLVGEKKPKFRSALEGCGYKESRQQEICEAIIKHFVGILDDLQTEFPNDFYYVDLITDSSFSIEPNDMSDEIHLLPRGCEKVARAFVHKLNEVVGS